MGADADNAIEMYDDNVQLAAAAAAVTAVDWIVDPRGFPNSTSRQ